MPTAANLFDRFENLPQDGGAGAHWAARAPLRPSDRFDVSLVPRSPTWRDDAASLDALEQIALEPWVDGVARTCDGAELCLDDRWIEAVGAALQEGDGREQQLSDLARGRRFAVQSWDAHATKALHVGHLRSLAIDNALAAALVQAGGRVEHFESDLECGEEAGALLIDELVEWLQAEVEAHPRGEEVLDRFGSAERVAAHVALGYFLPRPVTPRIDFFPEKLLRTRESPGWDLARARAHGGRAGETAGGPAQDPDYRFAVVHSELHRRQLRLAVERLDPGPLARYAVHVARWYLERDRSEPVQRVIHTLLDRGARGLGLDERASDAIGPRLVAASAPRRATRRREGDRP
jgi:hypothetical protein